MGRDRQVTHSGQAWPPDKRGVDHVIDVVGSKTLAQSLEAVRVHGLITIAGMVGGGGAEKEPGVMSAMWRHCMFRGIILGSRKMFLDMVKFMEEVIYTVRAAIPRRPSSHAVGPSCGL